VGNNGASGRNTGCQGARRRGAAGWSGKQHNVACLLRTALHYSTGWNVYNLIHGALCLLYLHSSSNKLNENKNMTLSNPNFSPLKRYAKNAYGAPIKLLLQNAPVWTVPLYSQIFMSPIKLTYKMNFKQTRDAAV
jgi:hypothetical protein